MYAVKGKKSHKPVKNVTHSINSIRHRMFGFNFGATLEFANSVCHSFLTSINTASFDFVCLCVRECLQFTI